MATLERAPYRRSRASVAAFSTISRPTCCSTGFSRSMPVTMTGRSGISSSSLHPALAVPGSGADPAHRLSDLPGVPDHLALLPDKAGDTFVGIDNYRWAFNDTQFRQSIFNNFLWLLVVPAACTFLGLVIAVLTDRIWWGSVAKSLIFLPLAISFVGASVIWKFVYDYRGEGPGADRHPQRHRRTGSAATRRCGFRCPSGTISS